MYHNLFNQHPINEHFYCSQLSTVANEARNYICMEASLHTYLLFQQDELPELDLLCQKTFAF